MSTGQILGAGGGAALGAFLALPTGGVSVGMGALYGAQAGMMVGGLLDPPKGPTQSGPRLSDTAQQTSTYGATIPRVYGTIGVLGNIFWLENNKLKEVVKKKKSGGKGGGSSSTVKTYTYYGTFAVGLCEGPIAGVRRIWVGPDLVYDAGSDDLETIIASNQANSKFSIYLGDAGQQPDSRMQAEMGTANCPAYRGLAYVVVKDLLLTKYGNSIMGAPVKAEVVTEAGFGVQQVGNIDHAITPNTTEISFPARPCYVSSERVVFYDPATAGSVSGFSRYEAWPGRVLRDGAAAGVIGVGVPPNFDTDDPEKVLASSAPIFGVSGFNGPAGHIQSRGGRYVGVNTLGAETTLYYSPGVDNLIDNGCFAVALYDGDQFFSVHEDSIKLFDSASGAMTLSASWPVSLSLITADTRAMVDGGMLWIYVGSGSLGLYGFDIVQGQVTKTFTLPSGLINRYYNANFSVAGNLFIRAAEDNACHLHVEWFDLSSLAPIPVTLADVVQREVELSGLLTSADLDASALTTEVHGYRISGGSIRSAIEPLQGAFPFDIIQAGYKIKAVLRGQSPVSTIDIGDLGIEEQLRQSREMDTQLPTKIVATYLDKARNYDANEQFWERPSSGAVNTRSMELPIVMGATQALQVVERLGNLYWLERAEFGPFTLPPTFGYLEAGDVVTLHAGYADYELRLTTVNYQSDGSLGCSAKLNNPSLYISQAASNETPDTALIALHGPSLFVALDVPVVDETQQDSAGFVGVMTGYTAGWPGGVAVRSVDGGQTWSDLQGFTGVPTVGYARGPLSSNSGALIDQRTLTVDLLSGELESITRDQMLVGQNYAAYGVDGRWEIVRFQNAVLQADSSYLVSSFVRGDRGTEWATALHMEGDYFVLLDDPDNAFIGMAVGSVGVPATYRGITSAADLDSAADVPFTYRGVNLECLSPVYARGGRDGSGNFTGSFTRRSRLSSSWWGSGVQAPVGESTEVYEIDVISGSAVKRTITSATPAFSYPATDQSADFGSVQAAITFRIYQLSGAVGRGYPLEVTL